VRSKADISQLNLPHALVCVHAVVDVRGAGEGTLEIGINGPSGQNIPNNVLTLGPSQFEVTFVPCESGQHRANVTFNKENVTGNGERKRAESYNK